MVTFGKSKTVMLLVYNFNQAESKKRMVARSDLEALDLHQLTQPTRMTSVKINPLHETSLLQTDQWSRVVGRSRLERHTKVSICIHKRLGLVSLSQHSLGVRPGRDLGEP